MAHRVQISRAWCNECLSQCWFSYDESSGVNEHLGESNATKWKSLKAQGYLAKHNGGGVFTFTLYKDHLHSLPLEWHILAESKEPEYIQDW